ncbi:uncharacterized protein PAC_20187 [Phialocephala subalpina]|uniref:Heterokaryon incompatibility domain-containing protein n=1 Tax=Phialocephala subalpina TaxID=576137 RepID=A0A1L7XZ64_9HELO|nr:uncharacterized protein PAC_20187 [Phialocephala subalpina]
MNGDYTPLQERDEIRLLSLLPGTEEDPLVCSLTHARRSENPPYEALSYMWGAESPKKKVILNGDERIIGENLWFALGYLRYTDRPRVMWVDAICINQENSMERCHQVSQMGKIYKEATTVIIWLGEDDNDESSSYMFNQLNVKSNLENLGATMRIKPIWHGWKFHAFEKVCQREYWSRLWIIQEVVLARKIMIQCGGFTLIWEIFSQALFSIKLLYDKDIGKSKTVEQAIKQAAIQFASWDLKMIYQFHAIINSVAFRLCQERRHEMEALDRGGRSVLELVKRYKDSNCVDVRDKIFGLHEFSLACCKTDVPVDYSCSAYLLCGRILDHHFTWHSGDEDHEDDLSVSQELHRLIVNGALQQLGSPNAFPIGDPREFRGTQTANIQLGKQLLFAVRLRWEGNVTFVTPSTMNSAATTGEFFESHWRRRIYLPLPKVRSRISDGIHQVLDVLAPNPIHRERANSASCPLSNKKNTKVPPLFAYPMPREAQQKTLLEILPLISQIQQEQCLQNHSSLFLGLNGLAGIAPANTELGDVVCTSKDREVMAIVRKSGSEYRLVGRALSLNPGTRENADREDKLNLDVQVDLGGLQVLSQPSKS